jgi:hypothetical protein
MTDYIIYRITSLSDNSNVYIGSTTNFTIRKYQHKQKTINQDETRMYKIINENGGWDNFEMVPIETINTDKLNARIREEYWREYYKANLNSVRCYLAEDEKKKIKKTYFQVYKECNKEKMQGLWRKNYEENTEKKKTNALKNYYYKKEIKSLMAIDI